MRHSELHPHQDTVLTCHIAFHQRQVLLLAVQKAFIAKRQ